MSITTDASNLIQQMREAWAEHGIAEGKHGRAHVTISGFSRVNDTWPQPLARISVSYQREDGSIHKATLDDDEVLYSWDAVQDAIEDTIDDFISDEALAQLPHLGRRMREAQARLEAARKEAAEVAWRAYKHGVNGPVSKYQIAKAAGLPEATVGRWVNRPINL